MVAVSFYPPSLTLPVPAPPTITRFFHPFQRDIMASPFPFWHCLVHHFCQVEAWSQTRPPVHSTTFLFVRPSNGGSEGDREVTVRVPRLSVPPSPFLPRTHGGFSSNCCTGTLNFFRTGLGSFGEFHLSKRLPGPPLFVEPRFFLGGIGNTSMLRHPSARCSPPSSLLCMLFPSKCACNLTSPIN